MWSFRFWNFRPFDVAGSGAGGGSGSVAASTSQTAASTPASDGTSSASSTGTQQQTSTQQATGTQTSTQQPADDLQDGNWRDLRNRYEAQKAEIANLKANANPAAVAAVTRAQEMAKSLGYDDADFTEAFTKDPVRTIQILAEEAASKDQNRTDQNQTDLSKQIEDAVNAKLTPIQEAQNRQATEAAMVKYEQNLSTLITADPILKEAPTEVVDLVKDYLGEYFSTQPEILLAMKTKGNFSAMNDAVKFVSGRLHSAFKAWLSRSTGASNAATGATQSARPAGKFTLDDIINDPSVLGSQYK